MTALFVIQNCQNIIKLGTFDPVLSGEYGLILHVALVAQQLPLVRNPVEVTVILPVGEPVVVGIPVERIGAPNGQLLPVAQAVAVEVLPLLFAPTKIEISGSKSIRASFNRRKFLILTQLRFIRVVFNFSFVSQDSQLTMQTIVTRTFITTFLSRADKRTEDASDGIGRPHIGLTEAFWRKPRIIKSGLFRIHQHY